MSAADLAMALREETEAQRDEALALLRSISARLAETPTGPELRVPVTDGLALRILGAWSGE